MKQKIDVLGVVLFLIALAAFLAAAKGHGGAAPTGFFSGG